MEPVANVRGLCEDSINGRCKNRRCALGHMPNSTGLMDSHCHLDLMERVKGVRLSQCHLPRSFRGCVANFCHPRLWGRLPVLMADQPHVASAARVWATVGFHPKFWYAFKGKHTLDEMSSLIDRAPQGSVVAVGEVGLDYYKVQNAAKQREVFAAMCSLAVWKKLPVVVHCRDAAYDCLKVMQYHLPRDTHVHMHCFTGGWAAASDILSSFPNAYFGVTGFVSTYRQAPVVELVEHLPIDRLLLETDAPLIRPKRLPQEYTCTCPHPGHVFYQASTVAGIKHVPVGVICQQTTDNTIRMYNL